MNLHRLCPWVGVTREFGVAFPKVGGRERRGAWPAEGGCEPAGDAVTSTHLESEPRGLHLGLRITTELEDGGSGAGSQRWALLPQGVHY